jgi:hypothetical protein
MNEEQKYIELHRQLHDVSDVFRGRFHPEHVRKIHALIKSTNSKTLLDFGCGKGDQYINKHIHSRIWKIEMPSLYDPAIDEFSVMPDGIFDGVICADVMEHIPECAVDKTLYDVISRAKKFAYFHISTRLARTLLPNGENSHVTVKEHDWWLEKIQNIKQENDCSCIVLLSTQKGFNDNSMVQDILR